MNPWVLSNFDPELVVPAGFSFFHDPRVKCWRALLDLGESRLRASVYFSRAGDDPVLQQSLAAYAAGLDSWLVTLLGDLGFPEGAIATVQQLYGSIGLSLYEWEALSAPSSSSHLQEVD